MGRAGRARRRTDRARAEGGLRHGLVLRGRGEHWRARSLPRHGDRTIGQDPTASRHRWCRAGRAIVTENNLRLFTALLYSAQRRISFTSPYFVPDESLLYAVTTAAQRGVDVELFVSEVGDQFMVYHAQRSYYEALLEAGVRIYLYPAPAVLHSKHFSIDDDVAVIGSSNMDMRSFALNYEVSMMLTGGDIVARMREVEDTYRSLSPRAHARGVAAALVRPEVRRQRDAPHGRAAIASNRVTSSVGSCWRARARRSRRR